MIIRHVSYFLVALAIVLLLFGCAKEPVSRASSSNSEINVDRLFDYDGCTMYRFKDGGERHYYARCDDRVSTISQHTESCGKNCEETVQENIDTLTLSDSMSGSDYYRMDRR